MPVRVREASGGSVGGVFFAMSTRRTFLQLVLSLLPFGLGATLSKVSEITLAKSMVQPIRCSGLDYKDDAPIQEPEYQSKTNIRKYTVLGDMLTDLGDYLAAKGHHVKAYEASVPEKRIGFMTFAPDKSDPVGWEITLDNVNRSIETMRKGVGLPRAWEKAPTWNPELRVQLLRLHIYSLEGREALGQAILNAAHNRRALAS